MREVYAIHTPENVRFELELAGVGSRALAWVVDVAAMAALTLLALLIANAFGVAFAGLANALYLVVAFAIQWGYGAALEWRMHGQTLGKRLVGLRAVSMTGTTLGFGQAALRNLVRVVDLLPGFYLVGGLCALLDPHGRRLGDLAAATVVVRQRRSPRPSALLAPVDRYNSFSSDPNVLHAAQRITAPERDAMIALSAQRDELPVTVRYALFAKLARHLEQRLAVPRPDHLSEERFVLNLTAIALARRKSTEPPPSRAVVDLRMDVRGR